jgi:hypothetical protein
VDGESDQMLDEKTRIVLEQNMHLAKECTFYPLADTVMRTERLKDVNDIVAVVPCVFDNAPCLYAMFRRHEKRYEEAIYGFDAKVGFKALMRKSIVVV